MDTLDNMSVYSIFLFNIALRNEYQVKCITYPEVNILSLPGAKVEDVHRFLPAPGQYELIASVLPPSCLSAFKTWQKVSSKQDSLPEVLTSFFWQKGLLQTGFIAFSVSAFSASL